MKNLIALSAVFAAVLAFGYTTPTTSTELIALDAKFQAAVQAHDANAVGNFLADDFVLITSSIQTKSKAALLKELKTPGFKFETNVSDEVKARVHGDVAVVTAR